jgi:hypothetical protein
VGRPPGSARDAPVPPSAKWPIRTLFAEAEIRRVLRTERRLSPKSANFWALVYGIPTEQIAAFREQPSPLAIAHD